MGKHAFLILAHKSVGDLCNLIASIDDARNDIYIHLDAKWKEADGQLDRIKGAAKLSPVVFSERTDIYWGRESQVRGEMLLIEQAAATGYDYYHLLSGQDLVLKDGDSFHAFFERNAGKEFLTFCGRDWIQNERDRIKYKYKQNGKRTLGEKFSLLFQRIFGVDRLKNVEWEIVGGSNWASVTHAFAQYLLSLKDRIFEVFGHSFCADELYKHTLAYNSEFRDKIYLLKIPEKNDDNDKDMYRANMRYIDWVRGKPYVFTSADVGDLLSCEYMFARKFDSALDDGAPRAILEALGK